MQPLWTPWRMPYILAIKSATGCVFCDDVFAPGIEPDLILHRAAAAFVVLNLYPYTTGHLMVVPYRHVAKLQDLTPAEIEEMSALLGRAERAVESEYRTSRMHIGLNIGRCAGAGVDGHLHAHLVPRHQDAVGEPGSARQDSVESLIETRDRLRRAWAAAIDPASNQSSTS